MPQVLKTSICALFLFAAVALMPAPAAAAPITITYTMRVLNVFGNDTTLGLESATLTLAATFDLPQNYQDVNGAPSVVSTSNSLTISGASVAAANGTYTAANGLAFFPTVGGQIFDPLGNAVEFDGINGNVLKLTYFVSGANPGPAIGDPFSAAYFSGSLSPKFSLWDGTNGQYSIEHVDITLADATPVVPEPASLILLGTGLIGAAASRRRAAR